MDPIAAFKAQQARLGQTEATIAELRDLNPRWATIFDRFQASGYLQKADATKAFSQVLGAGEPFPRRRIEPAFNDVETEETGGVDFRQFCKFVRSVQHYMLDTPKWQEIEAAADEAEEKRKAKEERDRKATDVFEILGIKKPKEVKEMEARKVGMLARNSSLGSFRAAGSAVIASQSLQRVSSVGGSSGDLRRSLRDVARAGPEKDRIVVRGVAGALRSLQKAASIETPVPRPDFATPLSPTRALRDQWSRFDRNVSKADAIGSKQVVKRHTIDVPTELPQMKLGGPAVACLCVRFSEDFSMVAGGFFDGGLRIYDTERSHMLHCLNLSGEKGGTLKRSELANEDARPPTPYDDDEEEYRPLDILTEFNDPAITCLRWRPNCKIPTIATADTAGNVCIWEVPKRHSGRAPRRADIIEQKKSLDALCWNIEGTRVMVAGSERCIRMYDLEDGGGAASLKLGSAGSLGEGAAPPDKITGHVLKVVSLCASPANQNVLFSGGIDRKVLVWDTRVSTPVGVVSGTDLFGDAVDITRDGNRLFTGSHRSSRPFQVHDIRMLGDDADAHPGSKISFSSSVYASYDWRGDEAPFSGGARPTCCLPFSAAWDFWDSKTIVAAGEKENLARVYELPDDPETPLKVVGTFYGKDKAFLSAAISADGRNAAFGNADGGILLCDVRMR